MLLAFSNQSIIIIAAIAILIIQWPLAVFTAMKLFTDATRGGVKNKAAIVIWNVVIIFIPLLGAAIYLAARKRMQKNINNANVSDKSTILDGQVDKFSDKSNNDEKDGTDR